MNKQEREMFAEYLGRAKGLTGKPRQQLQWAMTVIGELDRQLGAEAELSGEYAPYEEAVESGYEKGAAQAQQYRKTNMIDLDEAKSAFLDLTGWQGLSAAEAVDEAFRWLEERYMGGASHLL